MQLWKSAGCQDTLEKFGTVCSQLALSWQANNTRDTASFNAILESGSYYCCQFEFSWTSSKQIGSTRDAYDFHPAHPKDLLINTQGVSPKTEFGFWVCSISGKSGNPVFGFFQGAADDNRVSQLRRAANGLDMVRQVF